MKINTSNPAMLIILSLPCLGESDDGRPRFFGVDSPSGVPSADLFSDIAAKLQMRKHAS